MAVIMGTAGHIDHGKTSLVRALTGIDCDRLAEEKRRGITIELGFAYLDLPDGQRVGVVDVPGHERFVKNMVAGAAGIDFVMLVIAADEGVMPQTREHLEICSLLGTATGLVALTKIDAVDEEWRELVSEDVREFLRGTFLEGAPLVPVSSVNGEGVARLRQEIMDIVKAHKARRRSDLTRLPVDRVFTMKGYGTVITGTLTSGAVDVGDDLVVYPTGIPVKVRSLQSHGASVQRVEAGRRTAVNVSGAEVEDISRGDVLAPQGALFPSQVWDARVTLLSSMQKPFKHRKQVHFHHGSREVMARVYLLDRDELAPGESAPAQIRFEEPLTGVFGDHFVMRSHSPLRTIGGGVVLGPYQRKFKRRSVQAARLSSLPQATPEELTLFQLEMAGTAGLSFARLLVATNLESKTLEKVLSDLGGRQQALMFDREERAYVAGSVVDELRRGILDHLAAFHRREPLRQGLTRGELASGFSKTLPQKLVHFLVERLVRKNEIVQEQEILRLPGHKVSLASDQAKAREAVMAAYVKGGITPPNLKDVLDPLGLDAKAAASLFKMLVEQGELVKVKEDMFFAAGAVESLVARITEWFATNDDLTPASLRDLTGLSRKYAIPVLEWLDKEKITVRVGDKRLLRKR
ncbi:selenocysteine-specific translation elongation factor [Alkalidesulfovibrio alkalitolerans DSM 16529]|jgi:selenocysteine-specific elongation factor|uniref:Selenocysteine-specific elongation factor n=1 Tax=Alkalidesulfovibrio alkalitolerans DSM 16529 TaxID=1121439 RepID=S7TGQ2_9BACT|nr:selenocysteine-specific translation elongation factor [Alkalidesulfovibrio alkalitolerans]EPR35765.1 selenocysteine-specific translation elongation factor [Alkalidesulfovibrio alkalitolerans DSM 16529]